MGDNRAPGCRFHSVESVFALNGGDGSASTGSTRRRSSGASPPCSGRGAGDGARAAYSLVARPSRRRAQQTPEGLKSRPSSPPVHRALSIHVSPPAPQRVPAGVPPLFGKVWGRPGCGLQFLGPVRVGWWCGVTRVGVLQSLPRRPFIGSLRPHTRAARIACDQGPLRRRSSPGPVGFPPSVLARIE